MKIIEQTIVVKTLVFDDGFTYDLNKLIDILYKTNDDFSVVIHDKQLEKRLFDLEVITEVFVGTVTKGEKFKEFFRLVTKLRNEKTSTLSTDKKDW